jgi:hypothetical protein
MTPQPLNQPPRRGLANPQVTAKPNESPAGDKGVSSKLPLNIPEPRWQQIVSVVIIVGFIVAWVILALMG